MKKLVVILMIGLGSLVLIACNQSEAENSKDGLYIGHITMEDETLILDEVEYITDDDQERMKELELSQTDMPNGYYIHNPSSDTESLKLAEDAEFHFVAYESLSFFKEGEDRNYTTTNREEFMEFLNAVENVVFWVDVKDGVVVSVKEEFMN